MTGNILLDSNNEPNDGYLISDRETTFWSTTYVTLVSFSESDTLSNNALYTASW